jgi:hypothetical protein
MAKEQNDFRAAENVEPTGQTAPLGNADLSVERIILYDYIGAILPRPADYLFYTSWGFMVY